MEKVVELVSGIDSLYGLESWAQIVHNGQQYVVRWGWMTQGGFEILNKQRPMPCSSLQDAHEVLAAGWGCQVEDLTVHPAEG